jgi:putative ABC transport system permease protein
MVDHIEGDLIEVYEQRLKKLGKRKADEKFIIDVILLFRSRIIKPSAGYKNLNT